MAWWHTRLFWGIHVGFLTLGAYCIADAVNVGIARKLEASVRADAVPPTTSVNRSLSAPDRASYRRILEGDLFHPSLRGQPVVQPETTAPVVVTPLDLPFILIGTGTGEGADSYAVLEDRTTREQQVYRLRDTVRDGAVLAKVDRNQAVLRLGTQEQILSIYSDGTQDVAPPGPGASPATRPTTDPATATTGIRQVQPNQWVLDKQEVNAALGNLSQLLTKARVVPNFSDGKPDGFKIFSIAPDSLYAKIGLQNGDVLQQINGVEIKDPENFMRVFQQLKDEPRIALDFVRNNRRESFSYEIR
ncbi:MAG: type II secretion system protein GspC [Nitrospirota bacterium]